VKALHGHL